MNGITTLKQSRRLRALGMEQGHWPQLIWLYGGAIEPGDSLLRYWQGPPQSDLDCLYIAAPVLLSGDPERPGVVEWMESQGWNYSRFLVGNKEQGWQHPWACLSDDEVVDTVLPSGDPVFDATLPALIDQILTEMEAQRALHAS